MVLAKDPWESSMFYIDADHLTAGWGQPGRSFYPSYCTWSMTCLYTNLGWVFVVFIAEFSFRVSFFDLYLHINSYHWNKEIMTINKEIYIVY